MLSSTWNKTCLSLTNLDSGFLWGGGGGRGVGVGWWWFWDHTTERGPVPAEGPGGFYLSTCPTGWGRTHYRATSGATSPDPWPRATSASLCSRRFFRWSSRRSRSYSFMRIT